MVLARGDVFWISNYGKFAAINGKICAHAKHTRTLPTNPEQPDEIQQELAHANQMLRVYARGLRVRTGIIFVLCAVLTLALAALIIDLCNPNLGWIRTALRVCVQV